MKTLENYIKVVDLIPNADQDADLDGSENPVDMQAGGGFDTVLALVSVGAITGTPDTVEVSFVEGDEADLSDATEIAGGAAVEVAEDTSYTFQLERSKRYVGAVLTFTGGTTPTAIVSAVGVLTNWARPFPLR